MSESNAAAGKLNIGVRASGELTEPSSMFCANSGDSSTRETRRSLSLCLVDGRCKAGPALALAYSLRGILCEALKEADSGGLEVLDGVCGRRRVGVRWRVRDDYTR